MSLAALARAKGFVRYHTSLKPPFKAISTLG
jgi:hypothetical protein